ncbi:MAG: DUF4296 domain-containing protein [Flavobacteriales bacterium]
MRFFLALLLPVYIFSCTTNSDATTEVIPQNVIDSVTFAKVLADMHIMDGGAKFQAFPDNRIAANKYSQNLGVLKKYHLDKAKFDSTMVYYSAHPDKFERVYNKVLQILSEEQALLSSTEKEVAKDTVKKDSLLKMKVRLFK